MIIRDYIRTTVDGKEYTWLVADIDNYLYTGDTPLTKHHLTMIPATILGKSQMNSTNSTEGGYTSSGMFKTVLSNLVDENHPNGIIGKAFKDKVITYRNLLTIATNKWGWFTRKVDLMSEINVYGSTIWSNSGWDTGIDNEQYAIFRLKPEFKNSYEQQRFRYWLKDISKFYPSLAYSIMFEYGTGHDELSGATFSDVGVRPRFLIG